MSLKEMKEQSFSHYHFDEWKQKAEESLKGKTLESLQKTTYENIVLKPLYTKEDEKAVSEFPGGGDFRRGIDLLGYVTNKWKVAQRITYKSPEELKEKLKLDIARGQTAIGFEPASVLFETKGALAELIQDYENQLPFAIDAKDYQLEFFSELGKLANGSEVSGYIACDPVASAAVKGFIPDDFTEQINNWMKAIKQSIDKYPNLQMVLVNATPYHNAGANAVQELAIAAATGVYYLDAFNHLDILKSIIFKFSAGANFFMEIAKFRAARIIWNKITETYGAKEESRGMKIAAETSFFTKTAYDPYVNLLRSGSEAFASVVGGVQYLHVNAFDELTGSSPFSERIARNIQLILKEEAHLTKVIDPAGGSWYVEELTRELAEKAWSFFQQIEANGGILGTLKSNWLQEKIHEVYEKRKLDSFTRKQSIIGTNVYANLDDAIPELVKSFGGSLNEGTNIQSIPQLRLSQPYEELRYQASNIEKKSGSKPQVGLICLGNLKEHKARMDFVRGFLSAGGITVQASSPIHTAEEAKEFVLQQNTKYFCICGSNDQYEMLGLKILQAVKSEYAERRLLLAGLPAKEDQLKWLENGLTQFIHVKSNCYETLLSILSEMEVYLNEQVQA